MMSAGRDRSGGAGKARGGETRARQGAPPAIAVVENKPEPEKGGAEVVRLDRFRKK